jgi:predicted DCC family thiol-disulfide oxidoreductase YuxK
LSPVFRALDRHFFAPARLSDLALLRIVCVGGALLAFPPLWAVLHYAQVDPSQYQPLPAMKVLMLPLGGWGVRPDAMFLHAVWLGTQVVGVTALVGLYTRPSLFLFTAGYALLSVHFYAFGVIHHTEAIPIIVLALLVVSPSGAALSVDALLGRLRGAAERRRFEPRPEMPAESSFARWPLRNTQWLLAMAYLSAGLSKLVNGGLAWFNGYTLVYYAAMDGLLWGAPLAPALVGHPMVASLFSIGAVALELTFWLAIVFPRLVPLFVLGGTALHLSIYLVQRAPFFQFIFLYVAFIESLRQASLRALPRVAAAPPGKWTVIYDGLCPLCIRTMTIFDALDIRHRLAYLDLEADRSRLAALAPGVSAEAARAAMHVVSSDGQAHRGFFAFRQLARILPPLWPLVPLLYLPLAAAVGPRLYDAVARNRTRHLCRAESCAA